MNKKTVSYLLSTIALIGFVWVFFMIGLYGNSFGWETAFSIMIPCLILSITAITITRVKGSLTLFTFNISLLIINLVLGA